MIQADNIQDHFPEVYMVGKKIVNDQRLNLVSSKKSIKLSKFEIE